MGRGLKRNLRRREDALSRIGWDQFEVLLAEHYRREGYRVEHVGTGGTGHRFDGGVDLRLSKDDARILVQCKHWTACQVPHNDVHQLLGVMVNEGATGAIMVTSGEFTPAAIRAANKQGHVQLVDGERLRQMLGPMLPAEPPRAERDVLVGGWHAPSNHRTAASSAIPGVVKNILPPLLFVIFIIIVVNHIIGSIGEIDVTRHRSPQAIVSPAYSMPNTATSGTRPKPLQNPGDIPRQPSTEQTTGALPTMTSADLEDWKRRNEEAMRIIEKTTPELDPPLPANDDSSGQ